MYHFLFLGKTKEKYLEEGIKDYANRLHRFLPVEIVTLKEKYSNKGSTEDILKAGAQTLLTKTGNNSFIVSLDSRGKQFDSPGLAREVLRWQEEGIRDVYFLIGGHLGLHPSLLAASNQVWSLSKLTYTHEMARMILMEQLYRAWTINNGQKYHK